MLEGLIGLINRHLWHPSYDVSISSLKVKYSLLRIGGHSYPTLSYIIFMMCEGEDPYQFIVDIHCVFFNWRLWIWWHLVCFDDMRRVLECLKLRIQCRCLLDTPAIQVILEINQPEVSRCVINFHENLIFQWSDPYIFREEIFLDFKIGFKKAKKKVMIELCCLL